MALIAFDADGVLIDFTGGLCKRLQEEGFPYSPSDVLHWDLRRSFHFSTLPTITSVMGEEGFCSSLPWLPGAQEWICALRNDGHTVVCVTSPHSSKYWMAERRDRLRELFEDRDILFVSGERKALVRADILVEDHPTNAATWCEANADGVAILVDRPWNSVRAHEWRCHPRMTRLQDDQILSWIRTL
jgi:5'(3')-deoxyribonucleotidase